MGNDIISLIFFICASIHRICGSDDGSRLGDFMGVLDDGSRLGFKVLLG
jgi:hypothetical protein